MENDAKNEYMPRETFGVGLALGGCLTLLPIQANILGVALATSQVLIQEVLSHLRFMIAFLLSTCVMFP